MQKEERERRKERLKLFSNKNQWMKKNDIEQTLDEMSSQLREYRRDLQQIRMQEAATEAKIDRLQKQVDALERSLHSDKNSQTEKKPKTADITTLYEQFESNREGCSNRYQEDGLEYTESHSTVNMYA